MRTSQMQRGDRRRGRGQSLIVAVIVLFVLLFIGGIFVAMVARNLLNTGRTRETVSALQFAEAGIRYADWFLQYGTDGADWRPAPTPMLNPNDPDKLWLQDTGNPWTRVEMSNGRALIRITYFPGYIPDPARPGHSILNPLGKYIRVESVGRSGFLNPNDPTTYLNTPAPRLSRKLVAYKQIGLTDYLRYVTNRYNDTKAIADIGVPPVGVPLSMQLGAMPVRAPGLSNPEFELPGAPMRVNAALNLMGDLRLALDRRNSDAVLVSGPVHIADGAPLVYDPETGQQFTIFGSDSGQFLTYGGKLRDNDPNPDANGFARGISALSPPLIDAPDPSTGMTRYRALSRNAGRWLTDPRNNRTFNTGTLGLGSPGLWINNLSSREDETRTLIGGQSLRSVWLAPGSNRYWQGPFYIPPGAFLEFGPQLVNDPSTGAPAVVPGFRIVRDDPRGYIDPNDTSGNARRSEMKFTFFLYKPATGRPVVKVDNPEFRRYLMGVFGMSSAEVDDWLPPFDGIIMAEGNLRVRGRLPAPADLPVRGTGPGAPADANPPSVTVVSGATIYVEGSLTSASPATKIALLATDYVVVNTTMFVGPAVGTGYAPSNADEGPPYHTTLTTGSQPLPLDFMFGDDPTGYTPFGGQAGTVPVSMLVRHGVSGTGSTYINLFVNEGAPPAAGDALYRFNTDGTPYTDLNPPPTVYVITNQDQNTKDRFEQRSFPLFPRVNNATYTFLTQVGLANELRPAEEPNPYFASQPPLPYEFDHAEIQPLDVRIEAVIYAQNGSFFIIPGLPMNMNPDDTPDRAADRARQRGYTQQVNGGPAMLRPDGTSADYPFYSQPIDCRITVVGAISENRTASVSDQAAWMQLWGYLPVSYGSTGHDPLNPNAAALNAPDQHVRIYEVGGTAPGADPRTTAEQQANITRGLRMLYDPSLALPYAGYNPAGAPFRRDDSGRILPALPRLPVCPGFVFYGEVR